MSSNSVQGATSNPFTKLSVALPGLAPILGAGALFKQNQDAKASANADSNNPTGYAAGAADQYAASGDRIAGGANPQEPGTRRASAGTIEAMGSVKPRLDQLTNLFAARKSYIQQKQLSPGLRSLTGGSLLT